MRTQSEKNNLINVEMIKDLATAKFKTISDFGKQIGIKKRDTITRKLNNKTNITINELTLMAKTLDLPLNDLFVKSDAPNN